MELVLHPFADFDAESLRRGLPTAVAAMDKALRQGKASLGALSARVHSLYHVPSQARTLFVPVLPGSVRSVRDDFGRFRTILGDF